MSKPRVPHHRLSDGITQRSLAVPATRSELARCKRDNTTLTVMVSDMDGFKQINDRFGHLEGNRCCGCSRTP